MPFKSVFRFLSSRGWSAGPNASNSNGSDSKWHRAEFIPASGTGGGGNGKSKTQNTGANVRFFGHSSSVPVYSEGNQSLATQKTHNYSTSHLTLDGVVDSPIAAPLAKPEPLADLDKPAIDSRQYSMQATTTSLSVPDRGMYGSGIVYEYVPKHHRAIKFADEDNDDGEDDAGVMSEAETSATVGANSHVRRRQGPQLSPYAGIRVSPQLSLHSSMNKGLSGDASPLQQRINVANGLTVSTSSEPDNRTGVVFLQYQGETKRAVLPVDPTENSAKTALRSLDDLRSLFLKAFPNELPLEYLRSPNVKIYIQDNTKSEFFYELDDLSDVKDRSVLKLHEPSTRANSPPPPPTQSIPNNPDHKSLASDRLKQLRAGDSGYNRYQRHQSNEDMNYFSEPEFDANGESRLQKSASASYYGGIDAAYHQPRRHFGTVDRVYGYGVGGNGSGTMAGRSPYDSSGGPPKPERHFGPGIPSGGRSSVRGSYSPPRRGETTSRHEYGQSPEQEEPYTRIGYREYAPSPTTEAAVDAIYQQRPTSRSGSATPVIDEESRSCFNHKSMPFATAINFLDTGDWSWLPWWPGSARKVPARTKSTTSSTTTRSSWSTKSMPPIQGGGPNQNDHPSHRSPVTVTPPQRSDSYYRVRMINMEKQLASLSSLVHSALMTKGQSETVYKDLEMLRKEIFTSGGPPSSSDVSDTGSVSRFSDLSSEKGSYQSNTDKDGNISSSAQLSPISAGDSLNVPPSPTTQPSLNQLTPEAKHQLRNAKRKVTEVQVELKNLRRLAQLNAQCSRDILKDAFDRLKVILNTNKHLHMFAEQAQQQNLAEANAISGDRKWVNQEEERYRTETRRVERGLSSLEREVEEMRQKVVNGERKLRMSEVESFTDVLTQIGRSAASLKNNFPSLEGRLKNLMSCEMEKVVREEKFIKDEPTRLDSALKRCKKLANTMVTMKKLAMVQDPAAYYGNSKRPPLPSKSSASSDFEGSSTGATSPLPYTSTGRGGSPMKEPGRSPYTNGGPNGAPRSQTGHVLDNLLEELQHVAAHKNGNHASSMTTEKRVGFADHIQVRNDGSGNSDTIKRAPKMVMGSSMHADAPPSPGNSILRTSASNSYVANRQQAFLSIGANDERRSESPSSMASSFRAAIPFLHSGRLGAPIRSPPGSVSSEPIVYHRPGMVPPPPPRSSSRNMVDGTSSPKASSDIVSSGSMSFRSEYEKKHRFFTNGGQERGTPAAIVQTNAVDDEARSYVKSASSSESVNSQDGQRRRLLANNAESDKAPPPPPPRNRQEMLEQRQHELMVKQPNNRFVKFQLPDGHTLGPE